jgi:hypothetical protein
MRRSFSRRGLMTVGLVVLAVVVEAAILYVFFIMQTGT